MLIFVEVHMTIDKNLRSSLGFGRTKESKGINKKKLKTSEENCSWSQKCFWRQSVPEVMTSSEESLSETSHQKLKITRSCSSSEDARLKASKAVQWI